MALAFRVSENLKLSSSNQWEVFIDLTSYGRTKISNNDIGICLSKLGISLNAWPLSWTFPSLSPKCVVCLAVGG